jgi:hypothetical protein
MIGVKMLEEIKKSISATLYERTSSPLFGAFFLSWIVWNWRIIMIVFFTEASELGMTKYEYIDKKLLDYNIGLISPLISTVLIIIIYPFLSEGAYRVWLWFDKRKNDIKNKIENQKLLTVEQSVNLRLMMKNKDELFESFINEKDKEIEVLKARNAELLSNLDKEEKESTEINNEDNKKDAEMEEFFKNKKAVNHFEEISEIVNNNRYFTDILPEEIISYYMAFNLIERRDQNYRLLDLTETGRKYLREYFKRKNSQ